MSSSSAWASFIQDPRRPEATALRASDRDRDVVLGVLAEGYADGRLTKDEYDERAGATAAARTLGELPALILDLVPQSAPSSGTDLAFASPEELQARALAKYEARRRSAVSGALVTSLVVTVIWALTGAGFFWPGFVILACALHVLRVLTRRQELVAEQRQRLEKKQRKALESPRSDSA
jgi:hypothetical protein